MNLNSFCDLTETSLAMWQPSIQSTYGNISESLDYISGLPGPMRLKYPNGMASKELISSLTEVWMDQRQFFGIFYFQGEYYYNAFEKDNAVVNIYFGKPTVFGRFLSCI